MNTPAPYEAVKAAVESRGFFTSVQPLSEDDDEGVKLVVASDGGTWGIGGISYWLTIIEGRWFVASWAPHIYAVPEGIDVAEVVTAAIRAAEAATRDYYDVQETVKQRFGLDEISVEEFERFWERSVE